MCSCRMAVVFYWLVNSVPFILRFLPGFRVWGKKSKDCSRVNIKTRLREEGTFKPRTLRMLVRWPTRLRALTRPADVLLQMLKNDEKQSLGGNKEMGLKKKEKNSLEFLLSCKSKEESGVSITATVWKEVTLETVKNKSQQLAKKIKYTSAPTKWLTSKSLTIPRIKGVGSNINAGTICYPWKAPWQYLLSRDIYLCSWTEQCCAVPRFAQNRSCLFIHQRHWC